MEAYALKGIIIALFVLGIAGLVLAALIPGLVILGSIIGSVAAILAGLGFLLLIRCRREC